MKIARIATAEGPTVVIVLGGNAYSVSSLLGVEESKVERDFYNISFEFDRNDLGNPVGKFSDLKKLVPVPEVKSIRDFYAFETHVREARRSRGLDMVPEWYKYPIFYFSNTSNLYSSGSDVPVPSYTREMDFELEIAIVIGKDGKNITSEYAWDHVFGLTLANDWSARDIQREEVKVGLGPSKAKDFATSLGPLLVTREEILARKQSNGKIDLEVGATVNDIKYSSGNLSSIYWDIEKLIEWASLESRLRTGDVLMTGTVGTGCIVESGKYPWLKHGDKVVLTADVIGELENTVI